MGKYTKWRGMFPQKPEEDPSRQQKLDEIKQEYVGFNIGQLGKALIRAKLAHKTAEAEAKQRKLELDALVQKMVHDLQGQQQESTRLDNGVLLSIRDEPYASVPKAEQPKFLAWVRENNLEDLLTVNYQTMSGMVKKRLVAGEAQPDGVKIFWVNKIGVTGLKGLEDDE